VTVRTAACTEPNGRLAPDKSTSAPASDAILECVMRFMTELPGAHRRPTRGAVDSLFTPAASARCEACRASSRGKRIQTVE